MIFQIILDSQGSVFIDDIAWSLGQTEFVNQVPTILSHLIQA